MKSRDLSRRLTSISEAVAEDSVGNLVGKLLSGVAYAHHQHLITTAHSRHITLKELYEGLPGVVDGFAEASIASQYSIPVPKSQEYGSVEEFLDSVMEDCSQVHYFLEESDEPELINPLEDIMTFLQSIRYKIRMSG